MSSQDLVIQVGNWSLQVPGPFIPLALLAITVCVVVYFLRPNVAREISPRFERRGPGGSRSTHDRR